MDDEVIEFLGCISHLQSLPSSSLKRIAQAVQFRHYDRGEHVLHKGEAGDGVYLIWEGEAEVSRSVNTEEEGDAEFVLKKYGYFGQGLERSGQEEDVVALTKLTCLVLPRAYCTLLQTKSIWTADYSLDSCPFVEHILQLDPVEVNVFRGITLPDAPRFGQVFGGQLVGQALAAASKTVDFLKVVNSLHSYFLLSGNLEIPILYTVHRLRDGKSFATRRVDAIQRGVVIFTLLASFQKDEKGFEHQEARMPSVFPPDKLLSMDELRERSISDPRLPREYRSKMATFVPWPIDIKFCEPTISSDQSRLPLLEYWFKAKGKLSDDQALHRCVAAYASDLIFLSAALNPHVRKNMKTSSFSLDHSMWFHRSFRADDWLLYVIVSPTAYSARGFCSGQMFNTSGELVVSLTQEGLIRKAKPPPTATVSKL